MLVVAEHARGEIRDVTRELISAARELGGPVTVAVIAAEPGRLAEQVDVPGVDEIVAVAAAGAEFENDVHQAAVEALIAERKPRLVLMGFTVNAMGYAPALAAKLRLGFASDVFAVRDEGGEIVAQRAFYGGRAHAEIDFPGRETVVLLLRPGAWPRAEGAGSTPVTWQEAPSVEPRARHCGFAEKAPAAHDDIATADFLVSLGRGVADAGAVARFEELAARMGAVVSVSRPIVDAGWMPETRLVGQSGKAVKPKVYLAFGISGAGQHLAGMKTADTIIAVDKDPEAAIFSVADYGATCDALDVAAELERLYER